MTDEKKFVKYYVSTREQKYNLFVLFSHIFMLSISSWAVSTLNAKYKNLNKHTCVTYKIIFLISAKHVWPIKRNTTYCFQFFQTSSSFDLFSFLLCFFLFSNWILSHQLFSEYTILYAIFSFVSY